MESELEVRHSLSEIKEGGNNTLLLSYLDELFPMYLSFGMTPHQYWEEDSTLAIAYREKSKYEAKIRNQEMWLQGAYFYNALCYASPLFNSMATDHTPKPYLSEPFPLTEQEKREQNERRESEKVKDYMMSFMAKFNKQVEEGENDRHE